MKGVLPLLNSRVKCGLEIISMERLGYYNGTYGPLEEMMIPMNDRASWFGDGVYDAGPCRITARFVKDGDKAARFEGEVVGTADNFRYYNGRFKRDE